MATSASARHHLFRKLEDLLGPADAATLMDHLPPAGWDDVASKADIRELRAEIAELGAELRAGLAATVTRAELREEIGLQLDARLGRFQRSTIAWSVAMNATMLSAVIAAIRL